MSREGKKTAERHTVFLADGLAQLLAHVRAIHLPPASRHGISTHGQQNSGSGLKESQGVTMLLKRTPPVFFTLNEIFGGFLFSRMPTDSNSCQQESKWNQRQIAAATFVHE